MRKELVETHEVPVTHAAGRRGALGGGGVVVRRESARDVARERQGAHDLEERVAPSARGVARETRARGSARRVRNPRADRAGATRGTETVDDAIAGAVASGARWEVGECSFSAGRFGTR